MVTDDFFEESTDQSKVKSNIVSKYFRSWASVIIGSQKKYTSGNRIGYIDLYAGPGTYADGTDSTPMLVLKSAISDPDIRERLVSTFNDKDENSVSELKRSILELPGIKSLKHEPNVANLEVDQEFVEMFDSMELIPSLLFLDPWGYKGLTLSLIKSVIRNWGCDCIFFFNYNRINMGLTNPIFKEHMGELFGTKRAQMLANQLPGLSPADRERRIMAELKEAFAELGFKFFLPFRFLDDSGLKISHHLVFVNKNFKGYELMKDIMAKESSRTVQGVATFEYNPLDLWKQQFELESPFDELCESLLADFAGQTISMVNIYLQHSVNRLYTKSNYKKALLKLEDDNLISTIKHRKGTFADHVLVTFSN